MNYNKVAFSPCARDTYLLTRYLPSTERDTYRHRRALLKKSLDSPPRVLYYYYFFFNFVVTPPSITLVNRTRFFFLSLLFVFFLRPTRLQTTTFCGKSLLFSVSENTFRFSDFRVRQTFSICVIDVNILQILFEFLKNLKTNQNVCVIYCKNWCTRRILIWLSFWIFDVNCN